MTDVIGGLPGQVEKVMKGNPVHARTLLEACLVSADRMRNVQSSHEALFMDSLIASIRHDQKLSSAETLGYNSDPNNATVWPQGADDIDWRITGVPYYGE